MATAPLIESDSLPWEMNKAPHHWDVTKPDIYTEDRWHPIFKEMREKARFVKISSAGLSEVDNIHRNGSKYSMAPEKSSA